MLSVSADSRVALRMPEVEANALPALLAEVPVDLGSIDPEDRNVGPNSPADELWRRVDRLDRAGETTASKLRARKRPRLLPAINSVVGEVVVDSRVEWPDGLP